MTHGLLGWITHGLNGRTAHGWFGLLGKTTHGLLTRGSFSFNEFPHDAGIDEARGPRTYDPNHTGAPPAL
jgi:hypothetical protein